jgi:hypothetical protein
MRDALNVHGTLHDERERGIPLTPETARKLEGWARWGMTSPVHRYPAAKPEKSSCKSRGSPDQSSASQRTHPMCHFQTYDFGCS